MIRLICSVSLASIAAMIASMLRSAVAGDELRVGQRLLGQRLHRGLDRLARAVGLRLELLGEQRGEFAGLLRRYAGGRRGRVELVSPTWFIAPRNWPSAAGLGAAASVCSRAGSLQHLGDQLLGAALAVHIGQQVRELGARLEQLVQRIDLARHRGRREVVHALEGDVDGDVALAGQRVGNHEGDPRLHRLHSIVEVVDVDLEEFAIRHRRPTGRPACRRDRP